MRHRIEHRKTLKSSLFGGTDVFVHLEFTEEEDRIIERNNMRAIKIVDLPPSVQLIKNEDGKNEKQQKDESIYFDNLYGRRTSYHCDSVLEANDLHKKLFEGLKQFNTYLEANRSPVEDTEGDFKIKLPEFSVSVIPDHMWAQHVFVLAESGGGKTQLLQTLYLQQMSAAKPPGFIIIDSQAQMIPNVASRFPNALVIHPIKNPISLDLFNPGRFDTSTFTTLDTFKYLFEAGGQPLTGPQQTAFTRAIALMLIGYPKAFNRNATIDDLEEYLTGNKKGKELPPNAHKAASVMPDEERNWYYNQYAGFDSSHSQILQRLNNICGPYTPLRPLFKKQHDTVNIYDAIENGRTILVDTDYDAVGRYASSFFGRFFLKILDKAIAHRNDRSHRLMLMVDEAQEYFDGAVMDSYPNQARKRNVSCVWTTQRLGNFKGDHDLRDALLGVGTLIATNVNEADIKEVSNRLRVELDQVRAWRPEYAPQGRPTFADFGCFSKGNYSADTFRLKFGQLESLPIKVAQESRKTHERTHRHEDRTGAPKDDEYDDRYDQLDKLPLSPVKARSGTVLSVKCPNGRTHQQNIPAGVHNGYRFVVKGASVIRRPDNRNGNYWVELEIAEMPGAGQRSSAPPDEPESPNVKPDAPSW